MRFKELAESYGFQIKDVFALINGVWLKRPDIQSVGYHGHHLMTIPRKIRNQPTRQVTLEGSNLPFYFDLEHKLRSWNLLIKKTPHIQGIEKKNLKIEGLEKLYEN